MSTAQQLTEGKPFPVLFRFALPVIGGNLFQLFYTLADTVIVGRTLGAEALAAVGATTSIFNFFLCFIQGFTSGFGILLGHRCGARNERGMRRSIACSLWLSALAALLITLPSCLFIHPILRLMQTPENILGLSYDYLLVILLGTGATIFYNIISNLLRALGDSRTPLIFLVFSSLLNILLDILFIVPFGMGVAGAAWATVLSQLIAALLSLLVGIRRFEVFRLRREDFADPLGEAARHLKTGLPMGVQMSVMCIGLLAVQAAVNALGSAAIAGFTAASKIDQLSVLINNAFGVAISNYVAQNHGAGLLDRIRDGVRASLIQVETANLLMCAGILLGRELVVPLFLEHPTPEIVGYASDYLITVAPFYLLLGLLLVYRSAIQSMGNSRTPFAACVIELVMRSAAAFGLSHLFGYIGVCFATPLAWIGAVILLWPVYRMEMARQRALPHPAAVD